ncbi:metabotropic glutamate receptor 4, partial [Biomphalaria glabrata]
MLYVYLDAGLRCLSHLYIDQGFNEVEVLLRKTKDICIALREKLLKDSGVPTEQDYDKIVFKLLEKEFAR